MFIRFNADNRTVFGFVSQTEELGPHRIDLTYSDDIGSKAYVNVKITVTRQEPYSKRYLGLMSAVTTSIFIGLLVYIVYMFHWMKISLTPET